ncbi:hypothetical protein G5714_007769 [Onychostoma macrolepis]|uniref:Uncharacterized protein n=1 Tax=Onychostoma macrolepis TaxID=369639 RepID=A0A7J6CTT4_9TELE|nr:hypothetical protein G5714_007769 [Onychostoma macrolepis]
MLQDEDFQFFLQLFHQIIPHVDMMYQQLQKRDIDAVFIKEALQNFIMKVQTIRDQSSFQEQEQQQVATEMARSLGGPWEKKRSRGCLKSTAQSAKDLLSGRHCLKPTAPQRRSQAAKDPVKTHLTQLPGPCSKDSLWHNRSSASSRSALTATGTQLCAHPTACSLHHQWKTSLPPD